MATHYFPEDRVHFTWDAGAEPVITIADGDTVVINTRDVSDNQIGPDSDSSVIDGLNWDRVYPLAGPIAVEGAKPGHTLVVEILDLRTRGWGWTAILPGLGLLGDDFPDAYLKIFDISAGDYARFGDEVAIPLTPFMGTMGVCPADASATPIMPPGRFGGNMDTRQLVAGTTLFLPIQVEGGMFSTGDAHGCQGDGEVCVTGLEAPMYATLRFSLDKKRELPSPQFRTAPGSLTSRVDHGGCKRHRADRNSLPATRGVSGTDFPLDIERECPLSTQSGRSQPPRPPRNPRTARAPRSPGAGR